MIDTRKRHLFSLSQKIASLSVVPPTDSRSQSLCPQHTHTHTPRSAAEAPPSLFRKRRRFVLPPQPPTPLTITTLRAIPSLPRNVVRYATRPDSRLTTPIRRRGDATGTKSGGCPKRPGPEPARSIEGSSSPVTIFPRRRPRRHLEPATAKLPPWEVGARRVRGHEGCSRRG